MRNNIGSLDRTIRIILGILILCMWFVLPGNTKYFALIGLIPLITAIVGFCPLYSIFGLNKNKNL